MIIEILFGLGLYFLTKYAWSKLSGQRLGDII